MKYKMVVKGKQVLLGMTKDGFGYVKSMSCVNFNNKLCKINVMIFVSIWIL
jgi:hypothetical protein